jgi:hypothetical protein
MKIIAITIFSLLSFSSFANSSFECEFVGPNYILTIEENDEITLGNSFKTYKCTRDFVNFPGTEIELKVLNCKSKNEVRIFYYAEKDNGDVILSKDLGVTKDVNCQKR